MALKKSDLYSSLWSSADELRGSMDASQYKDYVLTLLFVKYVSDKAKADPYALIDVPDDGSFDYLVTLKGKPDIGEKVNVAIRKLAEANDLQGVINNADFDDPTKLGSGKDDAGQGLQPDRHLPGHGLLRLEGRGRRPAR